MREESRRAAVPGGPCLRDLTGIDSLPAGRLTFLRSSLRPRQRTPPARRPGIESRRPPSRNRRILQLVIPRSPPLSNVIPRTRHSPCHPEDLPLSMSSRELATLHVIPRTCHSPCHPENSPLSMSSRELATLHVIPRTRHSPCHPGEPATLVSSRGPATLQCRPEPVTLSVVLSPSTFKVIPSEARDLPS
jgi:hypothetical protein